MEPEIFDMDQADVAWCPGCGDFAILRALKLALSDVGYKPDNVVFVSGIGQAGKLPHYIKGHVFNGLHGRSLSPATAIKSCNPGLNVIVVSGDGCSYGEGGNHFLHTIRRNPDITNLVHNNMVYGLTKGQASPTSQLNFETPLQVEGVFEEPFNPLTTALALGAGFVARAFSGDVDNTRDIIKRALKFKGYALVDIFQPCVSFNKVNTYQWFRDNTYYLEEDYKPIDHFKAYRRASETGVYPLGIFYEVQSRPSFEDNLVAYQEDKRPLYARNPDMDKVRILIDSKRSI